MCLDIPLRFTSRYRALRLSARSEIQLIHALVRIDGILIVFLVFADTDCFHLDEVVDKLLIPGDFLGFRTRNVDFWRALGHLVLD